MKVLLVDDHEAVRTTTAALLEDLGHEVFEAADGTEALNILRRKDCVCDLLITDYAMPHLSGTDFLSKARELCPNVPALIITGYVDANAIGNRPANVEILPKPFTPNALDDAITRTCQQAQRVVS